MNVKISPFTANGIISAPPSKSFAHRLIISAFISGGDCLIKNVGASQDVKATVYAVSALGAEINYDGENVYIGKITPVKTAQINCSESGSTLRFLIPVAGALGINAKFTGSPVLLSRPVSAYTDCFLNSGASFNDHEISGKLKPKKYFLDASLSSQYVSGLLFGLAAVNGVSEIILTGKNVSQGYADMTVSALKTFGVKIIKTDCGYKVYGGEFSPLKTVTVEGDWSGAAFPLSLGAICGKVTVTGLSYPSLQKDCEIVDILRKFGAKVTAHGNSVTVENRPLTAIKELNCENIPDLVQVICSLSAYAKGVTCLTGVSRLKIKESDRIYAVINSLSVFNIKAEYDGERLTVTGGTPCGGTVDGGNDHRTVMSAAVLASKAEKETIITGAEAHKKSYVSFFEDYKKLGGITDVCL